MVAKTVTGSRKYNNTYKILNSQTSKFQPYLLDDFQVIILIPTLPDTFYFVELQ